MHQLEINSELDSKVKEKENQINLLMNAINLYFFSIKETMKSFHKYEDIIPMDERLIEEYKDLLDRQYKHISKWVQDPPFDITPKLDIDKNNN